MTCRDLMTHGREGLHRAQEGSIGFLQGHQLGIHQLGISHKSGCQLRLVHHLWNQSKDRHHSTPSSCLEDLNRERGGQPSCTMITESQSGQDGMITMKSEMMSRGDHIAMRDMMM